MVIKECGGGILEGIVKENSQNDVQKKKEGIECFEQHGGESSKHKEEMMQVEKISVPRKEDKKCLKIVDQNVRMHTLDRANAQKTISGEKWKMIQRSEKGKSELRSEENKENMSLRNLKRGPKIDEGLQNVGNAGQKKRLKVQEEKNGLYIQVRVPNDPMRLIA